MARFFSSADPQDVFTKRALFPAETIVASNAVSGVPEVCSDVSGGANTRQHKIFCGRESEEKLGQSGANDGLSDRSGRGPSHIPRPLPLAEVLPLRQLEKTLHWQQSEN